MESKKKKVDKILVLLRPNTFAVDSITWKDLREDLCRMTLRGLDDLYWVLMCKHKDAGK